MTGKSRRPGPVGRTRCRRVPGRGRRGPRWSAGTASEDGPRGRPARTARGEAVLGSVDEHAPDVVAVSHVLVALVDVLDGIGAGHQLVELQLALLVEAQQAGYV